MPKKSFKKSSKKKTKSKLEDDLFEDFDLEETNDPIYKKGKLFAVFGLLLALFLTLYLVFAPVSHSLYGKLVSQSFDKKQFTLGDISINFSDSIAKELSFIFQNNNNSRKVETSVCLLGLVDGKNYSIDKVFYPLITHPTYTEVSFNACPDDTLIMLQTHPVDDCVASKNNLNILRNQQKINENVLMLVICNDNNYALYS